MADYKDSVDYDDPGSDLEETTLRDIGYKLDAILEAVKSRSSANGGLVGVVLSWTWFAVFIFFLSGWAGSKPDRFTDRLWYSMSANASWKNVDIQKRPPDCDFFHAPVGGKGCRYVKQSSFFGDKERKLYMQQARTDEERQAYASRPNTVVVYWEKKEE